MYWNNSPLKSVFYHIEIKVNLMSKVWSSPKFPASKFSSIFMQSWVVWMGWTWKYIWKKFDTVGINYSILNVKTHVRLRYLVYSIFSRYSSINNTILNGIHATQTMESNLNFSKIMHDSHWIWGAHCYLD